jgi:small subunit ribosomal protein S9
MAESKKYIETVGRRKTASARVRLSSASKHSITVNGKAFDAYFPQALLRKGPEDALAVGSEKFAITAVLTGGGISAQAGALTHAIARALVKYDAQLRKDLKKAGHLKRDPRAKERKKPGLKKARKRPQWSKR